MSASFIITPILYTFLEISVYESIVIALASDVLASAVSTYTYKKVTDKVLRKAVGITLIIKPRKPRCFSIVDKWQDIATEVASIQFA